jgi:redox-sensitive bicupin YhaK (pirin superfamily)
MAEVIAKKQPGKIDPFGTGKVLVKDCLDSFPAEVTDPFLLLHAFGPMHISSMPQFGMHPHRGFNEVPYLKKGAWLATDPWNMEAEGEDARMVSGQLQWGKAGRGIEHGMKFDETYDGDVMGFQLWVNLRTENKLDPPVFQNARPDALPLLEPAPKVQAKLLVGKLLDSASPVDTTGVDATYIDYMLEGGGEMVHPRAEANTSAFCFVYDGSGSFGTNGVVVKAGETMQFGPSGDIRLRADQGTGLGCLLLTGRPLKEPIVQHGPFVMSSRAQIMQAFEDYQRGANFIGKECEYRLHTAEGTAVTKRNLEQAYLRRH